MKKLYPILCLFFVTSANAQMLLNVDGETPNPLSDKSGNNTITAVGTPLNTDNAVEFPTGDDYLIIDPFVNFDLDADWTVSFDIKMTDPTDSVYVIDWRSNSNVGHMHIGYTGGRGLYFSDRNINGLYGSLVSDPNPITADTWVHFDVSREGDSLVIDRENAQVASSYFDEILSPLSTTTIGYSEDFRYPHDGFMLDNLTLNGTLIASVGDLNDFEFSLYPNPVVETINFSTKEKIDQVRIYNVVGEIISTSMTTNNRLNASDLKAGIYFLELRSESGTSVQRFVKQ
jgi:hypothetical protein